jgi:phage baseplate assembly protein W
MLTDKRERLFLPSFGLGLRSRLFEQITIDTYEEIKAQVITGIESYFPTVRVEQLDVTGDPNRGIIYIQFSYSITNTRESDNITLSIQNG